VEQIAELIQAFSNLDQHLPLITQFGWWLYIILFAIVFFETGLIIMSLMPYRRFLYYNLIGGLIWVGFFVFGGYFFGNIPLIRDNLPLVLIAVLILSTLPAVIELAREKRGGGTV